MHDLYTAILWGVIQTTLFAIAAAVVYLIARRFGPRVGVTTAFTTLMVMFVLALMSLSPWPRWKLPSESNSPTANETPIAVSDVEVEDSPKPSSTPGDVPINHETAVSAAQVFWETFVTTMRSAPAEAVENKNTFVRIIPFVFIVGLTTTALWRAAGLLAVRRQLERATPITSNSLLEVADILRAKLSLTLPVRLYEAPELTTAATVGWPKTAILLPESHRTWSQEELEAVLAHELAHIARRDFSTWLFAQLGLLFHFYHPIAHWFARRLRLEQELAADALAARLVGNREVYLRTLAKLALDTPPDRLAWPTQAFLPVRSTFLRRIEMLRNPNSSHESRWSGATSSVSFAALLLAAVIACGVRVAPTSVAVAQAPVNVKSIEPIQRELIPDADIVTMLDVGNLVASPAVAIEIASEAQTLRDRFGVELNEIDHVIACFGVGQQQPTFIIRSSKPHEMRFAKKDGVTVRATKAGNRNYFENGPIAILPIDDTTYVIANPPIVEKYAKETLGPQNPKHAWWAQWQEQPKDQNVRIMLRVSSMQQDGPAPGPLAILKTITQEGNHAVIGATLHDDTSLRGILTTPDAAAATKAQQAISQGIGVLKELFPQAAAQFAAAPGANEESRKVVDLFKQLLDSAQAKTVGANVTLTANAKGNGSYAAFAATLLPAVQASRAAAKRQVAMNNLKQIGIALLNYETAMGEFPKAKMFKRNSKHPYSWRVAILPFLEEAELANLYRYDEPWDSETNKKVLEQMPSVFRSPQDESGNPFTSVFAPVGVNSVLNPKGGKQIKSTDISDGISNTILVFQAKQDTPWTKPIDIDVSVSPIKLESRMPGTNLAVKADGSVHAISSSLDQAVLKSLFVIDDGGKDLLDGLPGFWPADRN